MRLQLRAHDRRWLDARLAEPDFPRDWQTMAELSAAADAEVDALRRARLARAAGPVSRLRARFDDRVRTDAVEWMDRAALPEAERTEMVRRLHHFNRVMLSYPRFWRMLRPAINAVHSRERRPVRLLELASGAGELTLALDRLARRKALPIHLTGSDIVQSHVDRANRVAEEGDQRARFRRLDAMDLLPGLTPGDYDIIYIVQAAHHFEPGQLATMVAQARLGGARFFVVIDGVRSLRTLALLPPVVAVIARGHRKMVHDAWLTARKFYADAELELIARVAAPTARDVALRSHPPGFVTLTVRF